MRANGGHFSISGALNVKTPIPPASTIAMLAAQASASVGLVFRAGLSVGGLARRSRNSAAGVGDCSGGGGGGGGSGAGGGSIFGTNDALIGTQRLLQRAHRVARPGARSSSLTS